ncbi:hypothetical protein, partial [Mesorhizobium sp.]|uniref:hypothetical protein n=1 Tax=Mesorhizobium sp. TaxID=1871066 RepID=UPI0025800625
MMSSAIFSPRRFPCRDSGTVAANLQRFDARPGATGQAVIDAAWRAAARRRQLCLGNISVSSECDQQILGVDLIAGLD